MHLWKNPSSIQIHPQDNNCTPLSGNAWLHWLNLLNHWKVGWKIFFWCPPGRSPPPSQSSYLWSLSLSASGRRCAPAPPLASATRWSSACHFPSRQSVSLFFAAYFHIFDATGLCCACGLGIGGKYRQFLKCRSLFPGLSFFWNFRWNAAWCVPLLLNSPCWLALVF